jgi:ABC-type transporter Mla subunit MlaD
MSDISALSHDYEATSQFAEKVNTAVLLLKKGLGGSQQQPDLEALAGIVGAVRDQLMHSKPCAAVPPEVVARLLSEHQSQLGYLIDDLDSAQDALRGKSTVDQNVIRTLDAICDAADASASAVFRRLRRR